MKKLIVLAIVGMAIIAGCHSDDQPVVLVGPHIIGSDTAESEAAEPEAADGSTQGCDWVREIYRQDGCWSKRAWEYYRSIPEVCFDNGPIPSRALDIAIRDGWDINPPLPIKVVVPENPRIRCGWSCKKLFYDRDEDEYYFECDIERTPPQP